MFYTYKDASGQTHARNIVIPGSVSLVKINNCRFCDGTGWISPTGHWTNRKCIDPACQAWFTSYDACRFDLDGLPYGGTHVELNPSYGSDTPSLADTNTPLLAC